MSSTITSAESSTPAALCCGVPAAATLPALKTELPPGSAIFSSTST
eukprot:CAMPEP_0198673572 /NCGR_PEP_ID=MMETSP1467-20131203/97171_1 /TAXON_ID=1462469 /ORGANISM="unid. sp., Strain CCMP2135" /LENGTH=45 /DNA_ID= /DNA_START= /DNA_END= /DNA_ORIENTATION=